jgi:hypothetical protein
MAHGKSQPRRFWTQGIVHGSEAWVSTMMNGTPDDIVVDFGNRIAELERLAIQSSQREQELRARLEEVTRAIIRNQASAGTNRDRNISEFKAVLNLKVLTNDCAG